MRMACTIKRMRVPAIDCRTTSERQQRDNFVPSFTTISHRDGSYHHNLLDRYTNRGQTRSMRVELPRRLRMPVKFLMLMAFTLYCTRNQKRNFRIGMHTAKARLRRALMRLQEQMRLMRHSPIPEQAKHLNQMLRGHDAYYGVAGNLRSLLKVHRAVERYWRKILSSRSWYGMVGSNSNGSSRSVLCLGQSCISLTRSCKLSPYCESSSDEPGAGNPHAGFCGSWRRVTASGHPVGDQRWSSLLRPPGGGGQSLAADCFAVWRRRESLVTCVA